MTKGSAPSDASILPNFLKILKTSSYNKYLLQHYYACYFTATRPESTWEEMRFKSCSLEEI